jgi:CRP-like cAMP-binding protein
LVAPDWGALCGHVPVAREGAVRNGQTNVLFQRLQDDCSSLPRQHVQRVEFPRGDFIARNGERIGSVIFPTSGLISVAISLDDGSRPEVAMIGHRGAVGGAALFGCSQQQGDLIATTGLTAWAVEMDQVALDRAGLDRFRQVVFGNEQLLLAQAQQRAACNAKHTIEQRLASWLLQAFEEVAEDQLYITQEQIAEILGVQRASISAAASDLQSLDLVRYTRGRVRMENRTELEKRSCGCHAAIEARRERLFEAR